MYVVVTEKDYGGEDKYVRVFFNEERAQEYSNSFEKYDTMILKRHIADSNNATLQVVYVVVTDEDYGGEEKIQLFQMESNAIMYSNQVMNEFNVHSILLKIAVSDNPYSLHLLRDLH